MNFENMLGEVKSQTKKNTYISMIIGILTTLSSQNERGAELRITA